jgi:hypothetical protein
MPTPWICVGDFNEILDLLKKFGGCGCQRSLMEAFQNTLEFCELFELDFRGPYFNGLMGKKGWNLEKRSLTVWLQIKSGLHYIKGWKL